MRSCDGEIRYDLGLVSPKLSQTATDDTFRQSQSLSMQVSTILAETTGVTVGGSHIAAIQEMQESS